jgi:hypothetical protein
MEISLGQCFYRLDSLPLSNQECANFYAMRPEKAAPTKVALLIPSGIEEATTAGANAKNRGGHNFLGLPYFVQGTELYRIDQAIDGFGAVTYSSTLVSGATPLPGTEMVIMADNGQEGGQMVIVCPALATQFNAYIYTTGGGLVAIADSDFDGPVADVNYVDGYFWFTKSDGQKVFISDLRDGSSYISTDFTRAEADPDYNVRSFILRNQPYVFGEQTVQAYQNVGGTGFPFTYIQGSVQAKGLASIYAIAEVNDLMAFLGGAVNEKPSIWISNGGSIEKLATIAIDQEIASYSATTIQSCFTWNYSEDGAQFLAFSFPGERCFVYDFTSQEWHTRESVDNMGQLVGCRIASVVKAYGVLLCGDLLTNKIGILQKGYYFEYGEYLPRRFVTPQIDNEGQPFFIDSVEPVVQSGVGLTTGQGSNPQISLSVSRNGGRSFEGAISRSIGRIGEYDHRTIWTELGRVPREVCFKFEVSDPVSWAITKVEVNFD